MDWIQALVLGLLQGLTEFLPVSSSGHIELGKAIMGVNPEESLIFTVVVHGATVLSTIIVFWKDIIGIFKGLFKFKWNYETNYVYLLVVSMVPAVLVGLLLEDKLAPLFEGRILFVGIMLMVTAALLAFTFYATKTTKDLNLKRAVVIGIAQAIAILPGISRSGSTIATALFLGVDKEKAARFSFLMVLLPIIGANALDLMRGNMAANVHISPVALLVGFVTAFLSGLLACKWMISIVKKGKLIYFAAYCLVVGIVAIIFGLM